MQNENVYFFLWTDSETKDQSSLKNYYNINKIYKEKLTKSEEFNYEIKIELFMHYFIIIN